MGTATPASPKQVSDEVNDATKSDKNRNKIGSLVDNVLEGAKGAAVEIENCNAKLNKVFSERIQKSEKEDGKGMSKCA